MAALQQNADLIWHVIPFSLLSPLQLHDLLKVRVDVFVVEQQCAYEEIDGKDPDCFHIVGINEQGRVVATARIAPPGVLYPEASIGRVAILKHYRGSGRGYEIMKQGIDYCKERYGDHVVKIAAQHYLEGFYSRLGFVTSSGLFKWDGIEHVYMLLNFGPTD